MVTSGATAASNSDISNASTASQITAAAAAAAAVAASGISRRYILDAIRKRLRERLTSTDDSSSAKRRKLDDEGTVTSGSWNPVLALSNGCFSPSNNQSRPHNQFFITPNLLAHCGQPLQTLLCHQQQQQHQQQQPQTIVHPIELLSRGGPISDVTIAAAACSLLQAAGQIHCRDCLQLKASQQLQQQQQTANGPGQAGIHAVQSNNCNTTAPVTTVAAVPARVATSAVNHVRPHLLNLPHRSNDGDNNGCTIALSTSTTVTLPFPSGVMTPTTPIAGNQFIRLPVPTAVCQPTAAATSDCRRDCVNFLSHPVRPAIGGTMTSVVCRLPVSGGDHSNIGQTVPSSPTGPPIFSMSLQNSFRPSAPPPLAQQTTAVPLLRHPVSTALSTLPSNGIESGPKVRSPGVSTSCNEAEMEDRRKNIERMTVASLRAECRRLRLPITGPKPNLVRRLCQNAEAFNGGSLLAATSTVEAQSPGVGQPNDGLQSGSLQAAIAVCMPTTHVDSPSISVQSSKPVFTTATSALATEANSPTESEPDVNVSAKRRLSSIDHVVEAIWKNIGGGDGRRLEHSKWFQAPLSAVSTDDNWSKALPTAATATAALVAVAAKPKLALSPPLAAQTKHRPPGGGQLYRALTGSLESSISVTKTTATSTRKASSSTFSVHATSSDPVEQQASTSTLSPTTPNTDVVVDHTGPVTLWQSQQRLIEELQRQLEISRRAVVEARLMRKHTDGGKNGNKEIAETGNGVSVECPSGDDSSQVSKEQKTQCDAMHTVKTKESCEPTSTETTAKGSTALKEQNNKESTYTNYASSEFFSEYKKRSELNTTFPTTSDDCPSNITTTTTNLLSPKIEQSDVEGLAMTGDAHGRWASTSSLSSQMSVDAQDISPPTTALVYQPQATTTTILAKGVAECHHQTTTVHDDLSWIDSPLDFTSNEAAATVGGNLTEVTSWWEWDDFLSSPVPPGSVAVGSIDGNNLPDTPSTDCGSSLSCYGSDGVPYSPTVEVERNHAVGPIEMLVQSSSTSAYARRDLLLSMSSALQPLATGH